MNKKLFLLPIIAIVLILGGCSNSNRIDTSSLFRRLLQKTNRAKPCIISICLRTARMCKVFRLRLTALKKPEYRQRKPIFLRWRFQSLNCILSTQISEKKLSKPILTIFQKKPQFHLWPILPFRIQKLCNFFKR